MISGPPLISTTIMGTTGRNSPSNTVVRCMYLVLPLASRDCARKGNLIPQYKTVMWASHHTSSCQYVYGNNRPVNVQKGVGLAMLFSKSSVSQKILFWKETAISTIMSNTSTVAVWYTVNMDGNLSILLWRMQDITSTTVPATVPRLVIMIINILMVSSVLCEYSSHPHSGLHPLTPATTVG